MMCQECRTGVASAQPAADQAYTIIHVLARQWYNNEHMGRTSVTRKCDHSLVQGVREGLAQLSWPEDSLHLGGPVSHGAVHAHGLVQGLHGGRECRGQHIQNH
jgi:hypothetical protein